MLTRRTLRSHTSLPCSPETKYHARALNGQNKGTNGEDFEVQLMFANEIAIRVQDMHGGAKLRASLAAYIEVARETMLGCRAEVHLHAN